METRDGGGPMTTWVGFVDGKPHIYRDDRVHPKGVRLIAAYPSKRAAKLEYEHVRKMVLRPDR